MITLYQKKNTFSKIGTNPRVDWVLILTVSTVIACAFVVWSVLVYRDIKGIDSMTEASGDVSGKLDIEGLSVIIGIFDEKARQREELKRGYSGAPDPSI